MSYYSNKLHSYTVTPGYLKGILNFIPSIWERSTPQETYKAVIEDLNGRYENKKHLPEYQEVFEIVAKELSGFDPNDQPLTDDEMEKWIEWAEEAGLAYPPYDVVLMVWVY